MVGVVLIACAGPVIEAAVIAPAVGRSVPHLARKDCHQVEEVLDPRLRGKPIGIRQKYLLVTCNYTARRLGAKKMESAAEVRVSGCERGARVGLPERVALL